MTMKPATVVTVKDLSVCFNDRLMNFTRSFDEVIVVFNTYKADSLKSTTRQKRRKGKDPVQRASRSQAFLIYVGTYFANTWQKVRSYNLPWVPSSSNYLGRMCKLESGARLPIPSRFRWTHCRMAITRITMRASSTQPPLMCHQHRRLSLSWSDVSARGTAHLIAACASQITYLAQISACATHIVKTTKTHTTRIVIQMMTVMTNVICLIYLNV